MVHVLSALLLFVKGEANHIARSARTDNHTQQQQQGLNHKTDKFPGTMHLVKEVRPDGHSNILFLGEDRQLGSRDKLLEFINSEERLDNTHEATEELSKTRRSQRCPW
jgi:hypothetical protein